MPLYVADYIADTWHLDATAHGVYLLLLMCYWQKGPLPLDAGSLRQICRANSAEEIAALERVLAEFFTIRRGRYHNSRADREVENTEKIRKAKALAGKAGGIAARGKSGRKPNSKTIAGELQNNTPSPSPSPKPEEKEESTPLSPPKGGKPSGQAILDNSPKSKRRTAIPDHFPDAGKIEEGRQFWAVHARMDIANEAEEQAEHFRDHHRSRGSTMADWPAAWRTWTRNALKFNGKGNGNGRHKATAHDNFIAGLADFAGYTVGDADDYEGGTRSDLGGHILDLPSKPVKPRPS
jgi:uncharacterized protein YdaU (DUF1376 family)